MLLHGPGGCGKSTVIDLVKAYACEFCALVGHPFTSRTIVVTAMSGVAATLIHGETTHSAIGLNSTRPPTPENIKAWENARLLIIDEISFASASDFEKIQSRTAALMQVTWKRYGGLNVIFSGDYSQLEPINTLPVYMGHGTPEFQDSLNAYIELEGLHRFKDDLDWGHRLRRFRIGKPTLQDVRLINNTCLKRAPDGTRVATYFNKECDALNTSIFEEYCVDNRNTDGTTFNNAVLVLMGDLQMTNRNGDFVPVLSNAIKKISTNIAVKAL